MPDRAAHTTPARAGPTAAGEPGTPSAGAGGELSAVWRFARRCLEAAGGSHAWDHTLRVARLARRIGEAEGADMAVVEIAACLHDIGRRREDDSRGQLCHAREGARMAAPLLRRIPISDERRRNVLHCIEAHRFRGGLRPETLEAKVLFDADKLDAIGAVGVARAFLFAGEIGARLHAPEVAPADSRPYSRQDTGYREYELKLRHIRGRILTAEGRRLAEARHRFMQEFFERFLEEYEGKG